MADVFGQAIKAFYESEDESLEIEVFSDLAGDEHIPVSYFFREGEDLPDVEQKALSLSKGKILDIGAGAGTHTNSPFTGISHTLSDVSSPSVQPHTFYHAAMTYNSSDGVMVSYLDGVPKDTGSFPASQELHKSTGDGTYQQFYIGGNPSSGINVDIGMVSAYNRALESGEVYANCKAVKHRYGGGY